LEENKLIFKSNSCLDADLNVDEDEEELHLLALALEVDLAGGEPQALHRLHLEQAEGGLAVTLRPVVQHQVEGDEHRLK